MINAYHILFVIILLLGFLYNLLRKVKFKVGKKKINVSNFLLILAGSYLVLFSGLVGNVASDHNQYIYIYNNIKIYSLQSFFTLTHKIKGVEKGYGLLLWIIGNIFDNNIYIFILSSILVITPIILFAKKTKDPFLFLIFFLAFGYYFSSFNVIRQTIVASLFLFSIKYIILGNFKKYTCCIMLMSLIHISAILMLVFYFLLRQRKNVKTIAIHGLTFVVAFIGMKPLMYFVDNLLFFGRYSKYTNAEGNIKSIVVPIILFCLCRILINLNKNKHLLRHYPIDAKINRSKKEVTLLTIINNASIYWIMFWIMYIKFSYFERITYFFIALVLFSIVEVICNIKNNEKKIMIKVFVIFIITIYYFKFGQYFDSYKLFFEN